MIHGVHSSLGNRRSRIGSVCFGGTCAFFAMTAHAEVYTVDPRQSIQNAINRATAAGGGEIRVAAGLREHEAVRIAFGKSGAVLILSGGWDPTNYDRLAGRTTLTGTTSADGPLLDVNIRNGARVAISNFDVSRNSTSSGLTAGLSAIVVGSLSSEDVASTHLAVTSSTFEGNSSSISSHASSLAAGNGGAVNISTYNRNATVVLADLRVVDNNYIADNGADVAGGGLSLSVNAGDDGEQGGIIELSDSHISGNSVHSARGGCHGGGIAGRVRGSGKVSIRRTTVEGNSLQGCNSRFDAGDGGYFATEIDEQNAKASDAIASIEIRRTRWKNNTSESSFGAQLHMAGLAPHTRMRVSNSLLVGGYVGFVGFMTGNEFTGNEVDKKLDVVNVTSEEHSITGFAMKGAGATICNSLDHHNKYYLGVLIEPEVTSISNNFDPRDHLSVSDPNYVSVADGNFQLKPDRFGNSNAIDKGSAVCLGEDIDDLLDLDGAPRKFDGTLHLPGAVDLGAFEYTGRRVEAPIGPD